MVSAGGRFVIALGILVLVVGIAGGLWDTSRSNPERSSGESATPDLAGTDRATVAIVAPDGTVRGTLHVQLATTARERYVGLSQTATLGPNEGMLFVHDDEGPHAYVMRDMAFPIDIVFVDSDHRIAAIHHAPTEDPPLDRYRGRGIWVIETPYMWTTDHGVTVGDHVRIRDRENEN